MPIKGLREQNNQLERTLDNLVEGVRMTSPEKKKAVLYAREVPEPEPDPERFIYLFDKWDGLSKALDADADVVAVS